VRRLPATTTYYGLQVLLYVPTWVVMAVYLVQELGLSPLELVLMGTAMEAAVFLFEVPTGVLADTFSRRASLIVGYLGMGAAWMAVALVSEPWAIIALWALWGISYTFTSGAEEAWITDEVGVEEVGRVFLSGERVHYIGSIGGLILQVGIGVVSLQAGVIVGGAAVFVAGVLCLFLMPETGFRRRPRAERGSPLTAMRTTAVKGARYAWVAPVILLLVSVTFFMGMSSEAFDRLKEAHFLREVGLPGVGDLDPVVWFGMLWLAGMILGFFAVGRLLKRFERGGSQIVASSLFAFTLFELAAMLLFALTGSPWVAIAAALGVFLARNLATPMYTIWLNEQITDSTVRATVHSIAGQADAIGQAGGGPALGLIGNVWGIRAALTAGALVIAPALALYARAIAHDGREPELEELPARV
jgi:DHA3 family tetracycline resistance protein-like MFS transporter